MTKEEIVDYLYSIFNSKKNGVHQVYIEKMISKAISLIAELNDVDDKDVLKSLKIGQQIEREHTLEDTQFQKIIALQHLIENLDYYTASKPKNWAQKELDGEKSEGLTEMKENFNKFSGLLTINESRFESDNEEAQQYIDIISIDPNNERYGKYKQVLKDKFGIDYDSVDLDQSFIDNASLENIKEKNDFMSFDNYVKYAYRIFQLREFPAMKLSGKIASVEDVEYLSKIFDFKVERREYDGGPGNFADYVAGIITVPNIIDLDTLIHEIGHHFDHRISGEYEGYAKTITYASSSYYIGKHSEVFAENFMHYFAVPSILKEYLPMVYSELDNRISSNYKDVLNKLIFGTNDQMTEIKKQFKNKLIR